MIEYFLLNERREQDSNLWMEVLQTTALTNLAISPNRVASMSVRFKDDIKVVFYNFPFSPSELPSSSSPEVPFRSLYPLTQAHRSLFRKFTVSVNLYLTAVDDWHSRQVLVMGCVSLSRVPTCDVLVQGTSPFYQSSETLSSTFLNFFYFFRFVLFFVSSPSWEQGHYTPVLHLSQALF